jgi:membrane protease YdiL (CAAX protease family)
VIPHILATLLLLAFPFWDIWEARQLREASLPGARASSYLRMIIGLWAVALILLLIRPISYYLYAPSAEIGFLSRLHEGTGSSAALWLVVLASLLAGLLTPVAVTILHRPTRIRILASFDKLDHLLPRTRYEFVLFAAVSISAGICEEIIYRGFLIRYLQTAPWNFPLWVSLLISSIIFGAAHSGQGWKGMLATSVVGLLLAALFIAAGSLVVPIIFHVCIDLRGLVFAFMLHAMNHPPPSPEDVDVVDYH